MHYAQHTTEPEVQHLCTHVAHMHVGCLPCDCVQGIWHSEPPSLETRSFVAYQSKCDLSCASHSEMSVPFHHTLSGQS